MNREMAIKKDVFVLIFAFSLDLVPQAARQRSLADDDAPLPVDVYMQRSKSWREARVHIKTGKGSIDPPEISVYSCSKEYM